jgi:Fe-S cluster assembly ATP-binding protein
VQAHSEEEEIDLFDFQDLLMEKMALLEMDPAFAERPVNDGFSGGEKKRNEILQMAVLQPALALMDETDSGLDIDALKVVSNGVNKLREENPEMTVLLITHYQRLLNYIKPDFVHVMVDGRIVESGGPEVALRLEEEGYKDWREVEAARAD